MWLRPIIYDGFYDGTGYDGLGRPSEYDGTEIAVVGSGSHKVIGGGVIIDFIFQETSRIKITTKYA